MAGMTSMVSCIDDLDIVINKDDLVGKWHATDKTTEFWRFKSDGSGLTWDEADDVHEDDTEGKKTSNGCDPNLKSMQQDEATQEWKYRKKPD